jgi:protoporphyrinogen/coproporphyrinogen III oxidase
VAEQTIAIVGGGVAGLVAAHALHRRGIPIALLEASDRFGGVVRTLSTSGFLIEGGPDSFLVQKPEGLALVRELGLGDRLVPTNPENRTVYVLREGRLHAMPEGMMLTVPTRIGPVLGSSLFSWAGKLRMGKDLVLAPRRAAGEESVGSFLRRHFGAELLERLGEPLLAGIHAGDAECLSIQATFPRLVEMEARYGSLVRGLRSRPRPTGSPEMPSAFVSLAGGLGEMVDALLATLPPKALRTGAQVAEVQRNGDAFRLAFEGGGSLEARAVVVAVPAVTASGLLKPVLGAAGGPLGAIRFASTATIVLAYRRSDVTHPLDGYGLLVPRTEKLHTTACSFYSTKFPGRAPEGHILLRGFVGGIRAPDALDRDDAALAGTVRREMASVLGLAGEPVLTRVFRWPAGTPQMELGHAERVAAIERALAAVPGLFLTGSGLRGTGIPDTIADARRVAEQAAAHLL